MRWLTFIASFLLIAGIHINAPAQADAQQTYSFDTENSSIHLYGTSNVRDWDASVEVQNEDIVINNDAEDENWIETLAFEMPVEEIDSDSGRLNSNMRDYLGIDDHPIITYQLNGISDISGDGNTYNLTGTGYLTVNGIERNVDISAEAQLHDDGSVQITGEYETLMTEFNIDPPSAMLGTVQAEDDVLIEFDVTLVPES